MPESLIGKVYGHFTGHASTPALRIALIVGLALGVHVTVQIVRKISGWLMGATKRSQSRFGWAVQRPKVVTIHRLIVSGLIFTIYFLACGLILQELGINLTAYLASASVVGLAVSFGSQGLVQDIVSGLTLILLDTMNVGDMVEIAGTVTVVGIVDEIGLRFTKLSNFYNQTVLIPNRTIANVSRFPHGGVDAYADVWIPERADPAQAMTLLREMATALRAQFDEIILNEPTVGEPLAPTGGTWSFCRVHFKIWPAQGALIETTFRQEVVKAMKSFDAGYADWQVPVTYRAGAGTSLGKKIQQQKEPPASRVTG